MYTILSTYSSNKFLVTLKDVEHMNLSPVTKTVFGMIKVHNTSFLKPFITLIIPK